MIYNNFPSTVNGRVWATVTGPSGGTFPFWVTEPVSFAPGQWFTYPGITHPVPAAAPSGAYTFRVKAGWPGTPAIAPGDSLTFTKQ